MKTLGSENRTKMMRVLVANEPLSYREVISETLGELRPDAEVIEIPPEMLDDAVLRLNPDVVICNRASRVIEENVLVWAELYPDGDGVSHVSIFHERHSLEDMQLADLFDLLDRAALLMCQS